MEGWGEFAVATAGATGALAGLVIVAISVNVREIARSKPLLAGAGGTIASLLHGVIASVVLLIPDQPLPVVGLEVLVSTLVAAVFYIRAVALDIAALRRGEREMTGPVLTVVIALSVLQFAPFLIGSILLLAGGAGGAYAVAAGIILLIAVSMLNAWLLLIEVVRE